MSFSEPGLRYQQVEHQLGQTLPVNKMRRLFRSSDPAYVNTLVARCPGCLQLITISELNMRLIYGKVEIKCTACDWEMLYALS